MQLWEMDTELQDINNVKIKDMNCDSFKNFLLLVLHITGTILVTIFVNSLPNSYVLFYMIKKISPFHYWPRQYSNWCFFNYLAIKCKFQVRCRKWSSSQFEVICFSVYLNIFSLSWYLLVFSPVSEFVCEAVGDSSNVSGIWRSPWWTSMSLLCGFVVCCCCCSFAWFVWIIRGNSSRSAVAYKSMQHNELTSATRKISEGSEVRRRMF